uniref:Uncharacterized protein n=1 Tax=uncultured marine group II/III euryarchaeote KM3_115_A12 TaxID=1457854 RepID=A0A075GD43_9EURY|nr:hypothetical protein [uncultured marine group II/III euryarchaeote KM3_115_A12]
MSEMGLAVCCLMCDSPDETGTPRCRSCIQSHEKMRELVARDDEGALARFGKELLAMMSNPERYDHDEEHGEVLRGYVRLLAEHSGPRKPPTPQEIEQLFAAARARPKGSLIRDLANRSEWKDTPPSPRLARAMADDLSEASIPHTGKRTVPSRKIPKVDRSERPGEDVDLTDRITAQIASSDVPVELQDLITEVHIKDKKASREKWKETIEGLDDLLDE